MRILKQTIDTFKFVVKAIKTFMNEYNLKLNEAMIYIKDKREILYLEFYQNVQNNKKYAFGCIESDRFLGLISENQYEKIKQLIHRSIEDVENQKISKEQFFNICMKRDYEIK